METLQVMETGWAEGLRSPAVQVTGNGSHRDCKFQGNVFLGDQRLYIAFCLWGFLIRAQNGICRELQAPLGPRPVPHGV